LQVGIFGWRLSSSGWLSKKRQLPKLLGGVPRLVPANSQKGKQSLLNGNSLNQRLFTYQYSKNILNSFPGSQVQRWFTQDIHSAVQRWQTCTRMSLNISLAYKSRRRDENWKKGIKQGAVLHCFLASEERLGKLWVLDLSLTHAF